MVEVILFLRFVAEHNFHAANIITCVGSLKEVKIRLASAKSSDKTGSSDFLTDTVNNYEIVSLVGTIEATSNKNITSAYGHLHISLADPFGKVIGGHLVAGCIVYTTAEITIMELPGLIYSREHCPKSGYDELVIRKKTKHGLLFDIAGFFIHLLKTLKNFRIK
jgi:predicted DNA-binding protein with PD1-like motif